MKIGRRQGDAQRVAIQHLQAFDRRLKIELAGLPGRFAQRIRAVNFSIDHKELTRQIFWIEQAPEAVGVILRRKFATLAIERRIVGEKNARPQAANVDSPFFKHFGHFTQCEWHQFQWSGEVIVLQHRLENIVDDVRAVDAIHLGRIEFAGADGLLHHAQCFRRAAGDGVRDE